MQVTTALLSKSTCYPYNSLNRACSSTQRSSLYHFPGQQNYSFRPCVRVALNGSPAVEGVVKVENDGRKLGSFWGAVTSLASVGGGASVALTAFQARAEEVVVDTSAQAADGAADALLGVLFTAAFIGLSILTIGVLYLSVTEWLEKRERDALAKVAGSEQDKLGAPVKDKLGRFAPKGFGKKVEKSEKDKKVEQKR
ncbi:hypothetical protein R1sor_021917 [Riccia sorocarpa]|uniref:Uncharacterized protein n=1 Tax=Riccia sorocarpa TaxID=122646 RepID=A0ABD3GK26_9MARC